MEAFYKAPCLTDSLPSLRFPELKKVFKGVGKAFLSQAIHKFINYNQEYLTFLDINASINGIDPNAELSIITGRYIGAIPLRSPVNGKQIGDFLVYPRFSDGKFLFSQLTQILMMLNESVEPEYLGSLPLVSGGVVRPPHYYDAVKYIRAYGTAVHGNWFKFRSEEKAHPYPKASTNWQEYIKGEHDPQKRLIFLSNDNELSPNHREWQQAKTVFELAKDELAQASTPMSIRIPMESLEKALTVRTQNIQRAPVQAFTIHASDPPVIKSLKEQGNIFLLRSSKEVNAWRIDIAELFERYTQYIVRKTIREMPARFIANPRFSAHGYMPAWGLKYLEPDALILSENLSIAVDAKYKAHYYSRNQTSAVLKDTHREDLHQILAYCSFSSNKNKAGMLFYPANQYASQSFSYANSYNGTRNDIIIVGLPFEPEIKPVIMQSLWQLLNGMITPVTT